MIGIRKVHGASRQLRPVDDHLSLYEMERVVSGKPEELDWSGNDDEWARFFAVLDASEHA